MYLICVHLAEAHLTGSISYVLRGDCVSVIGNNLYTPARYVGWRGDGVVMAFRRQNQVRQLKDTW
jgi:hypothetical protein